MTILVDDGISIEFTRLKRYGGETIACSCQKNRRDLTHEETNAISKLLSLLSKDSYCYKIINQLKTTSSMSLIDELTLKTCHFLVPTLNNV